MTKKQSEKSVTAKLEESMMHSRHYSILANVAILKAAVEEKSPTPSPSKICLPDIPPLSYEAGTFVEHVLLLTRLELAEARDELEIIEGKLAAGAETVSIEHSLAYLKDRIDGAETRAIAAVAALYPIHRIGELTRAKQLGVKRRGKQEKFNQWVDRQGGIPRAGTNARNLFIKKAEKQFDVGEHQVYTYMKKYREAHE